MEDYSRMIGKRIKHPTRVIFTVVAVLCTSPVVVVQTDMGESFDFQEVELLQD